MLEENRADLQTVVTFLAGSGHENVYIQAPDGTMQADLEEMEIDDPQVTAAVKRLLDDGAYLQISKNGDTIHLLQWRGLQDIGSGTAISVGNAPPDVEFVTELIPITDDGWYYYVSNYNSWRSGTRPE